MSKITINSAADFQKQFNVSRETIERLEVYVELLNMWQKKINLVSNQTLADVWQRHIADSAQLFFMAKDHFLAMKSDEHSFDFGAGAGFPGLVLAILSDEQKHDIGEDFPIISLVEGSAKKCAFMRDVIRATKAPARVINKRIETLSQISNSVNTRLITARALAPLNDLFEFAEPVWSSKTKAYFLKGNSFRSEISEVEQSWTFELNKIPSLTNQDSVILEISALSRKEIEV